MAGSATSHAIEIMRLFMNTVPERLTYLVAEGTYDCLKYIIMGKHGPSLK